MPQQHEARKREPDRDFFAEIHSPTAAVPRRIVVELLDLAIEVAREGREGRKIGTLFVVGDEREVAKRSRCLILDPLAGHAEAHKKLADPNLRETVKELAQLDGGFIVSADGYVLSATCYFNASSLDVDILLGLGTRHIAAASISKQTNALAVVVSESSIVRVFSGGVLTAEILPELWLLSRFSSYVKHPRLTEHPHENIMIVAREDADPSGSA
jgi:DNA integrity scanning protein DisA with diadenylate cyclase activity